VKATHKLKVLQAEAKTVLTSATSIADAARKLGVSRQSVHTWIKDGKVPRPSGGRPRRRLADSEPTTRRLDVPVLADAGTADEWAARIRATFDLDASEDALVDLAAWALRLARDAATRPETQLAAAGRFAALVRQLNFEPAEATNDGEAESAAAGAWPRRVG